MTKILLMNIPGGPYPADFPPFGISRVIEGLDPALNSDVSFLDLDYLRLSFKEIKNKIHLLSPQIIGFSAILTHAYSYLKELSTCIKNDFPDIIQVLGGEMAVISNIVLLKTKIDFCVTGESEPTFSILIAKLQQDNFNIKNKEEYRDIKGLVYLLNGISYFTGYADESSNSLKQMNWELISKYTNLEQYMKKIDSPHYRNRINKDEIDNFFSLFYGNNLSKRIASVCASKGCVGKCTFCHRFFKGYKTMDPDTVINYIEGLTKKYDIGLVQFTEENFGSGKEATAKIIHYLKEKKLNWTAGAARSKTADEATIRTWKESGCVQIGFGTESCSQKILDIIEKKTTVEENLNALRLLNKYGIFTIVGLVIGMPGETEGTIEETIRNLSTVLPDDIQMPYEICINWFQAVPGTPGYEYARHIGFIKNTLEDEEKYIENLYNIDANNIMHYLNFTDYEKEEIAYWKDYIFLELVVAYIKKHGIFNILKHKKANRYKYGLVYMIFPKIIRKFLLKHFTILRYFGLKKLLFVRYKKLFTRKQKYFSDINNSLRVINKSIPLVVREDEKYTYILREGR